MIIGASFYLTGTCYQNLKIWLVYIIQIQNRADAQTSLLEVKVAYHEVKISQIWGKDSSTNHEVAIIITFDEHECI